MQSVKISAPVGLLPRQSGGNPVKNKPADVLVVRQMLEANKIGPLGASKKVDAGLLKAIGKYQKKIGIRFPDQVIDPDSRTFSALKPKYVKSVKEIEMEPMVMVKYRNRTVACTEKELEGVKKDVIKTLTPYMKSLVKSHKVAMETYEDYLDTAQMKDGMLNAVTQAIIIGAGSVKMPSNSLAGRSIRASSKLEQALSSKNLAMVERALPEAEQAINAFQSDLIRFLNDFTGSASTTAYTFSITSAVCFTIVGALAAPPLAVATGMSKGAAVLAAGGGLEVLRSAGQELAKHASGQKVTLWSSVKTVAIDGTIGLLTAGLASKLPLGWVDDAAKALAPRIASRVPFMATKQLERFIANYLSGSGSAFVMSTINQSISILGEMVKKGKAPTSKDFDKAAQDILYAVLMGGMVKNLGVFQRKWAYKNREVLQSQIMPARWDKLIKANNVPKVTNARMWSEVMNSVTDKALHIGFDAVIESANGDENEAKLSKIAETALRKDKKLQALIDKEIKKAMKKYKIKPK